MHQAITAGARWMNRLVVLSRLCNTRLLRSAGILKVMGPAQIANTVCSPQCRSSVQSHHAQVLKSNLFGQVLSQVCQP